MPTSNQEDIFKLTVDMAVMKRDIENTNKDIVELKESIAEIKGWAIKAFWIIAGGVLLQATRFVLEGGISGVIK